jgi:ABC-type phosphate transport system substrate-binding protein
MRRVMIAVVALLGLEVLPQSAAIGASPPGFKVIVYAANSTGALTTDELSQLFLKRMTQWRTGGAVVPVDLSVGSPVREAFSKKVHGRSAAAVETFWTKQIFSGAGVPPLTLSSEREVVNYVRQNAGAIGYVSANVDLGEGLKTVDIASR